MIVVIADDITGAAEIGGIALRYGLRVLISDDIHMSSSADVLVIYTNTRSLSKDAAISVMLGLTKKVKALNPSLFFKKTDSVLRGHVLAELKAHMEVMDVEKALLVPANPVLGRTIRNGQYFLNGEPIHQTGFSSDPEFPIQNSNVRTMLGNENIPVHVVSKMNQLSGGVSVGNAETMNEVKEWARHHNNNLVLAGAASFFAALLEENYKLLPQKAEAELTTPLLLVSGTTFQKSIEQRERYDHITCSMPLHIFKEEKPSEEAFEKWATDVTSILVKHKKAIIAIGRHDEKVDSNVLREKLGRIVQCVFEKTEVAELLIEGGSTAYTIIQQLGLSSFTPTNELQQGVVRMNVKNKANLHLTIKPGSYDWPPEWNFN